MDIIKIVLAFIAFIMTVVLIVIPVIKEEKRKRKYKKEFIEQVQAEIEEISEKVEEYLESKGLRYYKKNDYDNRCCLNFEIPMYDVVFRRHHICFSLSPGNIVGTYGVMHEYTPPICDILGLNSEANKIKYCEFGEEEQRLALNCINNKLEHKFEEFKQEIEKCINEYEICKG